MRPISDDYVQRDEQAERSLEKIRGRRERDRDDVLGGDTPVCPEGDAAVSE